MLKKIYQFLGSIYFAITILIFLIIFIILGTFLESFTGSHLYASSFTYSSPFFFIILSSAFCNILISALHRWPFKKKHIPFLITHLGLLMMIGSVIIKNIFGIQGNMHLYEGSSSHQVLIPYTYGVKLEKKGKEDKFYEIASLSEKKKCPIFLTENEDLKLEILKYLPNSKQKFRSWIINKFCYISGLNPIFVYEEKNNIPISSKLKIFKNSSEIWDIYALKSSEPSKILKKLYLKDSKIFLKNFKNNRLQSYSLRKSIKNGLKTDELKIGLKLYLSDKKIEFIQNKNKTNYSISSENILNQSPWKIDRYIVELRHVPKLIFIEEEDRIKFYAIDRYGHIYSNTFFDNENGTIITYDQGYGGYYSILEIPFISNSYGALTRLKSRGYQLQLALQNALKEKKLLAPPLELLKKISVKSNSDFIELLLKFLLDQSILNDFFSAFDLNEMQNDDLKAAYWSYYLRNENEKKIKEIKIGNFEYKNFNELRDKIFLSSKFLPEIPINEINKKSFRGLLKEYFLYYGILNDNLLFYQSKKNEENDLKSYSEAQSIQNKLVKILPFTKEFTKKQKIEILTRLPENHLVFTENDISHSQSKEDLIKMLDDILPIDFVENYENIEGTIDEKIVLESPLIPEIFSLPTSTHIEENVPSITVKVTKGKKTEIHQLIYDPMGKGWKWPAFNGEYLLSFQPKVINLPLKIRLHSAKEIKYPNSNQSFSYESELFITENNIKKPFSISMNHVYESLAGYRFYLSNIATLSNGIKRIQLAVNYDPLKKILLYPGAILVTLGIVSLFWVRSKKNKKKKYKI